jgi:hypothetical protein
MITNYCHPIKPLLIFGLAALGLFAQSDNGSIVGFAKDPSGGVVPKAKITVKNEGTGLERQTVTNQSGYYVMPNLLPGNYTVVAEAVGFKRFETSGNKLDSNSTLALDANLEVGATTEKVEVIASVQGLETESAALDKLVTERRSIRSS